MEMENTRGYEDIAKAASVFLDFNYKAEDFDEWRIRIFRSNTLAWTLIYLDGLKANLSLIKVAVD